LLFGKAVAVTDRPRRPPRSTHFVDALLPGRFRRLAPAGCGRVRGHHVLSMEIVDASAKVRAGGPKDHPDDVGLRSGPACCRWR
jgi:hypothetical protein